MSSQSVSAASPASPVRSASVLWFAITTLLSAFLVFQVQPVISKCVLPWFGGTPAVWTTCMLFFQVVLFGGYAYAHLSRTFLRPRNQAIVHLLLLAAAALALPIEPSEAWKPIGSESPVVHLLTLLLIHIGLPYFVLSSTGPLLQAWMAYQDSSDRVYRLYALSNVGSLSALLSYPFVIEPWMSVSGQSVAWSIGFCAFVLVEGWLAIKLLGLATAADLGKSDQNTNTQPLVVAASQPIAWHQIATWIGLPAVASAALLTVTNHVCQDVAVTPFLWVLPLSLYLLSFIICFDSPRWYRPKPIALLTIAACAIGLGGEMMSMSIQIIIVCAGYIAMLFGLCMLCHGEVARAKPASQHLTLFYMCMSGGGAIGGFIVAIVCPWLFRTHAELLIIIAAGVGLAVVLFMAHRHWGSAADHPNRPLDWSSIHRLRYFFAIAVILPLIIIAVHGGKRTVMASRNFFGVLKVQQSDGQRSLVFGNTVHGTQWIDERSKQPTSYYGRESGVGRSIAALQSEHSSISMGVVGLGCGVLATYGRQSDHIDYYEINPGVIHIAENYFTYLSDGQADQAIHLGDGRLVLERQSDAKFDLLVLDAFSSDAIPAHLLTQEALTLYLQRLNPGGVMAIHITNRYLDLAPLVHRLAAEMNCDSQEVFDLGDESQSTQPSNWMLVSSKDSEIWKNAALDFIPAVAPPNRLAGPLWTDQKHPLSSVLSVW